jgi:puromycin-sensitive aminopeptidase
LHRRHTAKRTALSLLARAFQPKALLERTLDRTIIGESRAQDAPFIVSAILGNVYGRELAWDFVKTNWERMEQLLPKQGLRRMCCAFVSFATQKLERDVREFFAGPRSIRSGQRWTSI